MPADSCSTSPTVHGARSRSSNGHEEDFASLPPSITATANPVKAVNQLRDRPFSPEGAKRGGQKRRDRSLSSVDIGLVVNGAMVDDNIGDTLSKKRPLTDVLDYPRRRATVACEICRSRKTRCDGAKPKCQLCTDLKANCVYREPGIKLDAGDKLILEQLSRIENLLHSNMVVHAHPPAPSSESPTTTLGTETSTEDVVMKGVGTFQNAGRMQVAGFGTWKNTSANISTMPKTHTTPALHLLQWPKIRDLVPRPYDPQNLLQLEMAREPLRLDTSSSWDLSDSASHVRAFFERVNVWYACVNPYDWTSYYKIALSHCFREGAESCLVLLVLALGSASSSGSISHIPADQKAPGIRFFTAAWALIPGLMTRNTMAAAQCMILASAYLFYLVRPLEAWTLLNSTSVKLQLLLGGPGRIPSHSKELSERVYWNALLFESDLLAELDLPHSGIVQFEETIGLPGGFEGDEGDSVGRDELWYFLAEIALRRLLNRVSHLIYTKGATSSTVSLEPVVAELDYQLTQWYESLPGSLQFPATHAPLSNPVQTVLRLRYFACRTIIFRPYILAVLQNEQAALDPAVRENCRKCLGACIRQLEHIAAHHAGHLPYLWQGTLSIVSQSLLVMGATMSPSLSGLLPPPPQMHIIIKDVIVEIERYSHLAPSLRLSAEIVREAEERRHLFLQSTGLKG